MRQKIRCNAQHLLFLLLHGLWCLVALCGCAEEEGEEPAPLPDDTPLAILQRPFTSNYANLAPFDHDLPLGRADTGNRSLLSWWGTRLERVHNGHTGHDWGLPVDTPVLAAADGEVVFAGWEPSFWCGALQREASALMVRLAHVVSADDIFDTTYIHLQRIDVQTGQRVQGGQQIGLSGSTGCVNGPHLHFEVVRLTGTNSGQPAPVDPFGWAGSGPDPWAQHAAGATSIWLWKSGEDPDGGRLFQ